MLVVRGKTDEGRRAAILVEELDGLVSPADQPLDEVQGGAPRGLGAQAAGIAGPPALIPVLAPARAVRLATDARIAAVLPEVVAAIVAVPQMPDDPARAVAEGADVPAALPGLAGELRHGRVAADRREAVGVDPRGRALPAHHHRHERPDALRQPGQQRDALLFVGQELLHRENRAIVEDALRPDRDVGRGLQQPGGHIGAPVQWRAPLLRQAPRAIHRRPRRTSRR